MKITSIDDFEKHSILDVQKNVVVIANTVSVNMMEKLHAVILKDMMRMKMECRI